MYEATDWPDRIYVEDKHHQMYVELLGKGENDRFAFKTHKEIFMYATLLGVLSGHKKPLEKKHELIFERYLDDRIDKPIIQCIYLLEEKNDESIIDRRGAAELAQQYANGGFETLYEAVKKGYDMVKSLANYLVENHIQEEESPETAS